MSRPFSPRTPLPPGASVRINGKIRAREVRVIGIDLKQIGIYPLHDAIMMARQNGVDLVEIAPNATPPVCRLVDYGKYRYELSKRDKEAKKHQHATKVKEIQLTCSIDPHDISVKMQHGIDFLCQENKVKLSLRFRGREMMHKEIGFQTVEKFVQKLQPFGHLDAPAKLIGKGITVMLSPLPRNKRARNPKETGEAPPAIPDHADHAQVPLDRPEPHDRPEPVQVKRHPAPQPQAARGSGFVNNPFDQLKLEQ